MEDEKYYVRDSKKRGTGLTCIGLLLILPFIFFFLVYLSQPEDIINGMAALLFLLLTIIFILLDKLFAFRSKRKEESESSLTI